MEDAKSDVMSGEKSFFECRKSGRVRPLVLALILLALGLVFDRWMWQIGMILIVVLFVEACFRYRSLN